MKTAMYKRILCAALAVLTAAAGNIAAFAKPADAGLRIYRYVYDVNDDGTWEQGYLTDEAGNRVRWGSDAFVAAQSVFPETYDLRDKQLVTPVKNQCATGTCWAFGTIAAAESNYILQGYGTAEDTDFSEAHLVWFSHRSRSMDPTDPLYGEGYCFDNPFQVGGLWQHNSSAMMRGCGLQTEDKAPWNNPMKRDACMEMVQPESARYDCAAQLWSVESLWEVTENAIKLKIMQNGAAALAFYYSEKHYNDKHQCIFQKSRKYANHEVCVVGWDDTFSRKNFSAPRPKSDGAWLIKNSWGDDLTEDGYLWLSYEDTSIEVESYVMAPADVYDNRYQYDTICPQEVIVGTGSATMANVFTAQKAEELTHAAFFSVNAYPMPVTVEVYVGGADGAIEADDPLSGMRKADAATTVVRDVGLGYYTAELREPVSLQAGETFAVAVTFTNPLGDEIGVSVEGDEPHFRVPAAFTASSGESFIFADGKWQDTTAFCTDADSEPINLHNVPVKAMTRDTAASAPALTVQTAPQRTVYDFGETPDLAGLQLLYTAADGTQTVVEDGFTCLTPTLDNYGAVPVVLTYQGLRAAFTVQVRTDALSIALAGEQKTTLRYGDEVQIEPNVQGAPETAKLNVRYDLWIDGELDGYNPYTAADGSIGLVATGNNTKSYRVVLTLTDRFGDPIADADGAPITAQTEYALKCGPFYRNIYRFRALFRFLFSFLFSFIQK